MGSEMCIRDRRVKGVWMCMLAIDPRGGKKELSPKVLQMSLLLRMPVEQERLRDVSGVYRV